jgi:hypothetical protein
MNEIVYDAFDLTPDERGLIKVARLIFKISGYRVRVR